MDELIQQRTGWFEKYVGRLETGIMKPSQTGLSYCCPCCNFPTLSERGGYEICYLCSWEDDGQDEPSANEVWGGPNGDYSLTEARLNFKRYFTMYRQQESDGTVKGKNSTRELLAKQAIVEAFTAMKDAQDEKEIKKWNHTIKVNKTILDEELDRRVREFEAQIKKSE